MQEVFIADASLQQAFMKLRDQNSEGKNKIYLIQQDTIKYLKQI